MDGPFGVMAGACCGKAVNPWQTNEEPTGREIRCGETGQNFMEQTLGLRLQHGPQPFRDQLKLRRGRETVRREQVGIRLNLLLQAGYANHEDLIQVRGEDGQELASLQERLTPIQRFFEHTPVELDPAEFSIQESIFS